MPNTVKAETPRPLMKFNPEINTGTIIQICVIAVGIIFGYTDLKSRQDLQAAQLALVLNQMGSITVELKDIVKGQQALQVDVAVLRGRAAENSTVTSSSKR